MKANELRLGNWINAYHNDVQVTAINGEPDNYLALQLHTTPNMVGATHGGMYYPIPLTEEWLLKFGFEMKVEGIPAIETIDIWSKDGYRFTKDVRGCWFLLGYNWNTEHFQHVHQLQNLYFALTGTELEIK
jgi:hypothetical protein